MSINLPAPKPALTLETQPATPTREFSQLYKRMREVISVVFPDKGGSWNFTTGFGDRGRTDPPPKTAKEWLPTWDTSHPFAQELAQHYFTLWQTLEANDFVANGKTLYPHQRALFAWLTIGGICSGIRGKLPAVLLRSPYGSGKSLVGGLAVEGFQNVLLDRLARTKRSDAKLPRGMTVGLRRDLLVQNSLGSETYAALRPPYHVERDHAREMHRQLSTKFGQRFTRFFSEPRMASNPWYQLCGCDVDDEDVPSFDDRIRQYFGASYNTFIDHPQSGEVLALMKRVLDGGSVLVPDANNAILELQAPPRLGDTDMRFKGDMSYALHPQLGIRATHRHLLPDPSQHSTELKPDAPPLFGVFTGTTVTRTAGSVRKDVQEMLDHTMFMVADEAGKYSPSALRANTPAGAQPLIIGLAATAGKDEAAGAWRYSPALSLPASIELRITKPVGFAFIGAADRRYEQGSDEAWRQYEEDLFADVPSLRALGLPQPRETDGLVIVHSKDVRSYGKRLQAAYDSREQKAQVFCYDTSLGPDRWKLLEYTLRGTNPGVPRKIVATSALLSTGYSLPIDCVDVLCKVRPEDLAQLLGRLFHRRNMGGKEHARTYFRQQIFSADAVVQLRKIAAEMGYALPDTGATWVPYMCAIDATAKEADERRKGMGKPMWVPDVARPKEKKPKVKQLSRKVVQPPRPLPDIPEAEDEEDDDDDEALIPVVSPSANAHKVSVQRSHGPNVELTITLQHNGAIDERDIGNAAVQLGLGSYTASLNFAYESAYGAGKRGKDLVLAIAQKAAQLLDKRDSRK